MLTNVQRSIRMCRTNARGVALCLACLGNLVYVSAVNAAEVPPRVRQALQRSADALSPIRVSWTVQLSSDVSLQDWLKKVRLEAFYVDEFEPMRVTYAWQDKHSYSHSWQNKADITDVIFVDEAGRTCAKPGANLENLPRRLTDREVACDLGKVFLGQDRDASSNRQGRASLIIHSVHGVVGWPPEAILFEPSYFYEAGFALPSTAGVQGKGAKSVPLDLIEHGAKVARFENVSLDGRNCILLELEDEDLKKRFYLDPSQGYALRRREEVTRSGQPVTLAIMSDFVKLSDPDIWLPKHCRVVYHTWRTIPGVITEEPLATRTIIVHEIDKNRIPAGRFVLDYTMPYTAVLDSTLPQAKQMPDGRVRYQVPANLKDLDAAIQSAVEGKRFVPKAVQEANRALLERRESRRHVVQLTDDQRGLIDSLAEAASSADKRSAPIRVAIFDMQLPGDDPAGGLSAIFDSEPTCVWEAVSSSDVQSGALNRFDLVVFPGGSGQRQATALRDKGRQAVREFVRAGGGYVGICAGAFLATTKYDWALGLLDAKALTGKVNVPTREMVSMGDRGAGTVKIELTDAGKRVFGDFRDLLDADYSGGPIILLAGENDLPKYVPLALYRTELWKHEVQQGTMVDTPAILAGRFGRGRVILFSLHPETSGETEPLVTRAVLSVARPSTGAD
jgi:glutamine amidotransferase-like uncharacterized protein